ncbi:hypothetical protein RQP46_000540 [Phenoliferia psychrophenolica]
MRFGVRWKHLNGGVLIEKVKLVLQDTAATPFAEREFIVPAGVGAQDGAVEGYVPMLGRQPASLILVSVILRAADAAEEPRVKVITSATDAALGITARLSLLTLNSSAGPDVQFTFRNGRSLWATSSVLKVASPYFSMLLSSGFAEASISKIEDRKGEATSAFDEPDIDDSDDGGEAETDDTATLVEHPTPSSSSSSSTPCHRIAISSASYHTYRAILCWISSGFIAFAPLTSSFPSTPQRSSTIARTQALSITQATEPNLPLPISPKSAYRLAHFLELDPLKALALAAIRTDLSDRNAATELFSDTSRMYREVEDVVMEYTLEHWAAVKRSEAMNEAAALLDSDQTLAGSGAVALRLARRLREKDS